MKRFSSRRVQAGYSLLEVLFVVAILIIVAGAASTNWSSYTRGQALETGTRDLAGMLREAQGSARSRINSANWGVRVWNSATGTVASCSNITSPCGSNACAELFSGSSYSAANVTRRITVPSNVDLSEPTEGQCLDVIFQVGSSALASGTMPWLIHVGTTDTDATCNNSNTVECRLFLARYVGGGGNCASEGGSALWNCTTIDSATGVSGRRMQAAIDSSGHVWIVYHDSATNGGVLKLARSTPGTEASGTCAADWTCSIIHDTASGDTGNNPAITFDRSGNAWVMFNDTLNQNLTVARYLASSGADVNCVGNTDSASWGCYVIDDSGYTPDADHISLAFDFSGNPWVSYRVNNTILKIAHTLSAASDTGCTSNTDPLTWDCKVLDNTGTANGASSSTAISPAANVPWVRYVDATANTLKVATYVSSGGTGCASGVADWTCTSITANAQNLSGGGTIAFHPSTNTAWMSYLFDDGTTRGLRIARYVGSSGTGCSATAAWTCTQVDGTASSITTGQESALSFDNLGAAWIAYRYVPSGASPKASVKAAKYVSSGGSGCTNSTNPGEWSCWTVHDPQIGGGVGNITSSIALAGERVALFVIAQATKRHVVSVNAFGTVTIE